MKAIFGFLIAILVLGISSNSVTAQQPVYDQTTAAIDLNNFDVSTETKQKISTFFDQCPAGIILYKYMGEMYVYCLLTPISGILHGLNGQQIDVDIKVDNDDDNNGKHHDNDDNNNKGPDRDCLFNASLPKCDPDKDGNCPDDFNLNEDGNCFPDHHDCPDGTHGVDDDETGQCYKDDEEECPYGMEMVGNNCTYIETEEEEQTNSDEEEQPEQVVTTPSNTTPEETQQPVVDTEEPQEQQQEEEENNNEPEDNESTEQQQPEEENND